MAEGGLSALHEGLSDIGDAKGSFVGGDNLVVDDRGQVEGDIVLRHTDLAGHLDDLDFDIDGGKMLTQRVDLDKTRIDGPLEASIGVSLRCGCYNISETATYRPNLDTRPTSPWATGLYGLGQQMQHGIAPRNPIHSPRPWTKDAVD